MCPICIISSIFYFLIWVIGLFGFKKFIKWAKIKYYTWSKCKCDKCKKREIDGNK